MRLTRYRVCKPLSIHGRIAGCGEVIRLPEYLALEWIESGHLVELEVVEINGDASRQWTQPTVRQEP
jgi:hypothetical protein